MWEYSLIKNETIPKGAKVTPYAMMPKVLCCIEGQRGKVFINRTLVRHFFFYENALKKKDKLQFAEEKKAYKIFNRLTINKALLIRGRYGEASGTK